MTDDSESKRINEAVDKMYLDTPEGPLYWYYQAHSRSFEEGSYKQSPFFQFEIDASNKLWDEIESSASHNDDVIAFIRELKSKFKISRI